MCSRIVRQGSCRQIFVIRHTFGGVKLADLTKLMADCRVQIKVVIERLFCVSCFDQLFFAASHVGVTLDLVLGNVSIALS